MESFLYKIQFAMNISYESELYRIVTSWLWRNAKVAAGVATAMFAK